MALPEPLDPALPIKAARTNPMRGRVARSGDTPASTGNVANIVTVVRILLAPLFIWLLLADAGHWGPLRYVAAVLFVVAIVTDSVDGILARRQNLVTDFGKILDPIADKVLVGGALVALSILGELWWWVTIVILVREWGITIFRFAVLRRSVIPAVASGKLKTVMQAVAVSLLLFPFWAFVGQWELWLAWVVMGIALALTIWSGIDFFIKYFQQNRATATPRASA
ncbi:MAG: pgsA [Microbacteriaceae bacterium]|nr:pgsA [Microbacteriaceae bacterium]